MFLSKLGVNNTLELRYIRLDETDDIKLLKDVKEKFGKEYNVGSWVGCSKFRYKSDIKSARIQLVKLLTFNTLYCEIVL